GNADITFIDVLVQRTVTLDTGAGGDTFNLVRAHLHGAVSFAALGAGGSDGMVASESVFGGNVFFASNGESSVLGIQNGSAVRRAPRSGGGTCGPAGGAAGAEMAAAGSVFGGNAWLAWTGGRGGLAIQTGGAVRGNVTGKSGGRGSHN